MPQTGVRETAGKKTWVDVSKPEGEHGGCEVHGGKDLER